MTLDPKSLLMGLSTPWTLNEREDGTVCIVDADRCVVCNNERYYPAAISRADAPLITAAPALAQALADAQEREAARDRRITELTAALKTFVDAYMDDDAPDSADLWESPEAAALTFGDLRRARAALAQEG